VSPAQDIRRFHYQDSEHGQIHYWTAGSGPNLLLLHQSGNSSEEYAAIAPLLSEHFSLLAVDLPGHGRTYTSETQPTVDDYTAAVRHILNTLNVEKTHILGHHGGGLTAMALMAAEPDRYDRAILSGVDEEYSPEDKQAFIERIQSTDTTIRADPDFVAKTWTRYQNMLSDGAGPDLAVKPFMAFLDARLRPFRAIMTNLMWDRKSAISKLRGPVLIVTGEKDSYVQKQSRLISMIDNCEHIELKGAGTFMFYDYPKKSAEMVLEYLKH